MIEIWYTAAYRSRSGVIAPVGIDSRDEQHALGELSDWQRDDPNETYFLAYREVPEWQPLHPPKENDS